MGNLVTVEENMRTNKIQPESEDIELWSPFSPSSGIYRSFPPSQSWHQRLLSHFVATTNSVQYSALRDGAMEPDSDTLHSSHRSRSVKTTWMRRLIWTMVLVLPTIIAIVIIFTAVFFPSYTNPPHHYRALHDRAVHSKEPGRINIDNEKIFIASSIYDKDGSLVGGPWGYAVLDLIDMLGPDNVFLSIFEDDPGFDARDSLKWFSTQFECNSSIVTEHVERQNLPHVKLPDGSERLKRIAFLAHARNRALAPLSDHKSSASSVQFDKLLYINDVVFNPVDAANLLFSTNTDNNGKAQYEAVCATDFINPFKLYDTFATRDLEGHRTGVPIFPWFANIGKADSRQDVLDQKDAVRVRSCWGGMVAFNARWFQPNGVDSSMAVADLAIDHNVTETSEPDILSTIASSKSTSTTHPDVKVDLNVEERQLTNDVSTQIRFRSSSDYFWEASECCLVRADIQKPRGLNTSAPTGIYLNPYIRVAYDTRTLALLRYTRRFERLYAPLQRFVFYVRGIRDPNPRRNHEGGREYVDRVWGYNDPEWMTSGNLSGNYQDVKRIALPGGFCGSRKLLVLGEAENMRHWWSAEVPPDDETERS